MFPQVLLQPKEMSKVLSVIGQVFRVIHSFVQCSVQVYRYLLYAEK